MYLGEINGSGTVVELTFVSVDDASGVLDG